MKSIKTLCAAIAFTGTLAACSTTNLGLNPTVPEQAGGSISTTAIGLKEKYCKGLDKPTDIAACNEKPYGLKQVKEAFEGLYEGTGGLSEQKNKQEWAYGEIASTGGFGAVVGQLASQTALLNSGIALATVGLSMDSFYKPGITKLVHLRAEVMFQCLQRELNYVTEDERVEGEKAEGADGAKQAASAVRDVVEQIDSAITLYRRAVLTQVVSTPQSSDFSRFAKTYVTEIKAGDDAMAKATATTEKAEKEKKMADAEVDATKKGVQKATDELAAYKEKSLKPGAALAPTVAKALNAQIALATNALEERKNANGVAITRSVAAQVDVNKAKADAAAAKFVALKVNLETCVRGFGS